MVARYKNHVHQQVEPKTPQVKKLLRNWLWPKRLIIFAIPFALILLANVGTVNVAGKHTFRSTDETGIGILQYLPKDYYTNSDKYPMILFLHGFYERGIDSRNPELLHGTINDLIKFGLPRTIRKGGEFPFIIIAPQLKHRFERWPDWYMLEVLNWAKANLRVDEKRIHVTGLSLGGGATFIAMQEFPQYFASGAPVCPNWNNPAKAPAIAREDVAVWAFHGELDEQVPLHTTTYMIDSINRSNPDLTYKAQVRVYDSARHSIWDWAYTDDHSWQNPNLFEWMEAIHKTKSGDNLLPAADAGVDKTATAFSDVTLSGKGTDPDGNIQSYRWIQMYGPEAGIHNSGSEETKVSLSRRGTYMFRFIVTDDKGSTDTDYVSVTVK